ncbi:MAG: ABC transporter ATP-binding protein [Verrucomicrobiota bacterium]
MSSKKMAIEVSNLKRNFNNVQAVDGISFSVESGKVVGFIGANGAGKTTTMRILATLDLPDSGNAFIAGNDVVQNPAAVRRLLGWMPDDYGVYKNVTVGDYLDFYARAYGYQGAERARQVHEVMDFTGLDQLVDRPMNGLSKGMGQRLCFGRTLLHDPEILILDEPAAGLDPKARLEFKNLVRLLSERGKTIFISSHILSELAEMCDTMLFIDKGRIVHYGSARDLKRGSMDRHEVMLRSASSDEAIRQWLEVNPGWNFVRNTGDGILATTTAVEPEALAGELRRMIQDGLLITEFFMVEHKLEDVFVDMLRKVEGGRL